MIKHNWLSVYKIFYIDCVWTFFLSLTKMNKLFVVHNFMVGLLDFKWLDFWSVQEVGVAIGYSLKYTKKSNFCDTLDNQMIISLYWGSVKNG